MSVKFLEPQFKAITWNSSNNLNSKCDSQQTETRLIRFTQFISSVNFHNLSCLQTSRAKPVNSCQASQSHSTAIFNLHQCNVPQSTWRCFDKLNFLSLPSSQERVTITRMEENFSASPKLVEMSIFDCLNSPSTWRDIYFTPFGNYSIEPQARFPSPRPRPLRRRL